MKIILKFSGNIYNLMRQLGYSPHKTGEEKAGELSFVRRLNIADYPRFHAYVSPRFGSGQALQEVIINIHLDQKKPSYEGATVHSGEYEGELVEKEAERISVVTARDNA